MMPAVVLLTLPLACSYWFKGVHDGGDLGCMRGLVKMVHGQNDSHFNLKYYYLVLLRHSWIPDA
jgi:hypothetical protein